MPVVVAGVERRRDPCAVHVAAEPHVVVVVPRAGRVIVVMVVDPRDKLDVLDARLQRRARPQREGLGLAVVDTHAAETVAPRIVASVGVEGPQAQPSRAISRVEALLRELPRDLGEGPEVDELVAQQQQQRGELPRVIDGGADRGAVPLSEQRRGARRRRRRRARPRKGPRIVGPARGRSMQDVGWRKDAHDRPPVTLLAHDPGAAPA